MAGASVVRAAVYILTLAGVMGFAVFEGKLKRHALNALPRRSTLVSDLGSLRERFRDEEELKTAPRERLFRIRVAVSMKLLLVAVLVLEVLFFQR